MTAQLTLFAEEVVETSLATAISTASVRPRTIDSLRGRLRPAVAAFGDVPLREFERMSGEIASWRATLPERWRHDVVQALRQALEAACRLGYMQKNPAKLAGRNPMPPPRAVRTYSMEEIEAIGAELAPEYASWPAFMASTGLRPEEAAPLERRDIDRRAGVLTVGRTVSGGEVVELGKTSSSLRQMPLSRRALEALDAVPPRLDTHYVFAARRGGPMDMQNFRRRQWAPAIDASGVQRPARIYDLRSTFISGALASGIGIFTVAKIAGTSVRMIELHYGALLDGSAEDIARRLDAFNEAAEALQKGTTGEPRT